MKLKMVTGQGATPNSQSSQNILNTIQTANVQLPPGNEPAAKRPSDNRRVGVKWIFFKFLNSFMRFYSK